MRAYLGENVYWDEEGPAYKLPNDGSIYTNVLWIKKFTCLDNPTNTSIKTRKPMMIGNLADEKAIKIRSGAEYFFLPACGYYHDNIFGNYEGYGGYYWCSTIKEHNGGAHYFGFYKGEAFVGYCHRKMGDVPMPKRE